MASRIPNEIIRIHKRFMNGTGHGVNVVGEHDGENIYYVYKTGQYLWKDRVFLSEDIEDAIL